MQKGVTVESVVTDPFVTRALTGLDTEGSVSQDRKLSLASGLVWSLTGIAIAVGIAVRAWYVWHLPINSDVSIVGLMVQQFLHGHFYAFYWGQAYGGAEPYLALPLFFVFGSSAWVLTIVPVALAAAAGVLTWRIATRLVTAPALCALAGATVWAIPETGLLNSTLEYGFRGVTLVSGLVLILISLRIYDGQRTPLAFAALGVVAGIGWWSSVEIVYYYVPTAWLLIAALWRDPSVRRLRWWADHAGVALLAFLVGALPWLWANFNSGFASLRSGSFVVPPNEPTYGGRLHIFFRYMLPMLFSLRQRGTGVWLWGRTLAVVLVAVIVIGLIIFTVMCLIRDQRSRAIAVALILFPFILAISPATWYWGDGRYSNLCVPLLVLVVVVGAEELTRRVVGGHRASDRQLSSIRYAVTACCLSGLVVLSIASFIAFVAPGTSFFTGWSNPNGANLQTVAGWSNPNGASIRTIAELESNHVHFGYADYWLAYKLDYLSDGGLQLTTAGTDVNRWQAQNEAVRRARSQAWLFTSLAPGPVIQFGTIVGPDGMNEAQFLAALTRLGVGYHVVNTGLVQAVIPDRKVTQSEVGIP
jgi:hypothetical protein